VFDSRQGQYIFLYSTASRPALGPTRPPIKWIPGGGALSTGVKRQGREGNHSPLSNVKSRKLELHLHCPIRLDGVVLN
jgi:hypothetical protein